MKAKNHMGKALPLFFFGAFLLFSMKHLYSVHYLRPLDQAAKGIVVQYGPVGNEGCKATFIFGHEGKLYQGEVTRRLECENSFFEGQLIQLKYAGQDPSHNRAEVVLKEKSSLDPDSLFTVFAGQ